MSSKLIKMHILFWVLLFFLCGCGNANNKKMFIEIYSDFAVQNNMKAVALIYLDADDVPELLSLENNEYRVYTLDKAEVKEINISEKQIVAKAYGKKHDFEDVERLTFFWFEYVPYKGLIRVHESDEQGRSDYYLTYRDGLFETELIASSSEYVWRTTDGKKEISNEEFLEQLSVVGYDDLVPCEYLYSGIEEAYENITATSDNYKILDDFISGRKEALYYVKAGYDIVADGFVMRSYEDFYEEITEGEDVWGSVEYIDFDNDGEVELIMHGYAGARLFFDVIGDTVYYLLQTGGTIDNAYVGKFADRDVIVRADYLYSGRNYYRILTYDACGCVIDNFKLSASYEGKDYTEDDKFEYREHEISLDEFETLVNSIQMK